MRASSWSDVRLALLDLRKTLKGHIMTYRDIQKTLSLKDIHLSKERVRQLCHEHIGEQLDGLKLKFPPLSRLRRTPPHWNKLKVEEYEDTTRVMFDPEDVEYYSEFLVPKIRVWLESNIQLLRERKFLEACLENRRAKLPITRLLVG